MTDSRIHTTCAHCGSEIAKYPSQYNDDGNNYCDRDCYNATRRTTRECDHCGDPVTMQKHYAEQVEQTFCDDDCKTAHTETTHKTDYDCDNPTCDTTMQKYNSRLAEYDTHYCSWECKIDAMESPTVTVTCEQCGDTAERNPAEADRADRHFCSRECATDYRRGENHPNYTDPVTVRCWWCGDTNERKPSWANKYDRHFCDQDCFMSWRSWAGFKPRSDGYDKDMPRWEYDTLRKPTASELRTNTNTDN